MATFLQFVLTDLDLLAMAAIFPEVISSFFTQNKGGPGPPGPLP